MAIDLHTALYGPNGFLEQVTAYVAGEQDPKEDPPKGPFVAKVWYRMPGVVGREELGEWPVKKKGLSVLQLVEQIEAKIVAVLTVDPDCHLELKFWQKGEGSLDKVRFRPRIRQSIAEDAGRMDVEQLRTEVTRLRHHTRDMHRETVAALGHMAALASQQAGALANIAAMKGTAESASTMGGIYGLVGLFALYLAYPVIQNSLELPEGTSLPQTLKRLQEVTGGMLQGWKAEDGDNGGGGAMPPARAGRLTTGGQNGESSDPPLLEDQMKGAMDLLAELQRDPKKLALVQAGAVKQGIDAEAFAEFVRAAAAMTPPKDTPPAV